MKFYENKLLKTFLQREYYLDYLKINTPFIVKDIQGTINNPIQSGSSIMSSNKNVAGNCAYWP